MDTPSSLLLVEPARGKAAAPSLSLGQRPEGPRLTRPGSKGQAGGSPGPELPESAAVPSIT